MSNFLKNGWPIPRFDLALNFTDIQWFISEISQARNSEVEKFENKFAEHIGVKKAIYMNSARGALYLILQCLNLAPHSKVMIPAWTHHSIPSTIIAAGLQPHLVDIRQGSWVMGPETIKDEDWEGVSAIIITHMYGCPAPAEELATIARSKNIFVIEDCAQGFGATINGKKAGSFGDAAIFSFALTKNFTTLGGGMAVFQDQHLAEIATLRMEDSYIAPSSSIYPQIFKAAAMWAGTTTLGFTASAYILLSIGWSFLGKDALHSMFEDSVNTNAPDISFKPSPAQAALGRRLLDWAEEQNALRTQNGKKLIKLFKQADLPGLIIPEYPDYGESVFNSFVIGHIENEKLARQLSSHAIDTSPGYLKPIQQISILSDSVSYTSKLTNANLLARVQLHLPIYPRLKDADLERIVEGCRYSLDTILHYGGQKEFALPQVKNEKPHSVTYRKTNEPTKHNSLTKARAAVIDEAATYDIDSDLAAPIAATHAAPSRPAAPPLPTTAATHAAPPRPVTPPLPTAAATHAAPPRPVAPPLPTAAATHTAPPRPVAPPLPTAAATHAAPPRPVAPPLPTAAATHTAPPRPAAPPLSARPVASSVAKNILALRKNTTLSKSNSSDSAVVSEHVPAEAVESTDSQKN